MTRIFAAAGVLLAACLASLPAAAQSTLDAVKKRGELLCGTSGKVEGFSLVLPSKEWAGMDVDLCRGIAAAVLGDARKVKFVPVTPQDRFDTLRAGKIDVLAANVTFTLQREAGLGLQPAVVNYYDGQAFVVPKSIGVGSVAGLANKTVCVTQGTTHVANLAEFFEHQGLKVTTVALEGKAAMYEAFFARRCVAVTEDATALAASVVASGKAADYLRLPEVISKEPLGPYVRRGDEPWLSVVRWVQYAMIEAEELGVTKASVDKELESKNPSVQRLLGVTPGTGKALGLDAKWAYAIVKQVGNYGEIHERNVGRGSPLQFNRGINGLWNKGGLMYALPMR